MDLANLIQPTHLKNELVSLYPLQESDFERLFAVAADPAIWEQHPNKNRYQRDVFQNFFTGAMESKGAFIICKSDTNEAIGSSRFYDYNEQEKSILIGYTFFAKNCWGKGYNMSVKKLMLEHAFRFVDKVIFHVGASNIRSQKAMEKLGAQKTAEIEVAYFGEPEKLNFVYAIAK